MVNCIICDPKSKYNECICNTTLKQFDKYYEEVKCPDLTHFKIDKPWSISTITICAKYNSPIDLNIYKTYYDVKETKSKFYNCVNIYLGTKYQNKIRVSLKIFTNGNIQLAGVTNVRSATYCLRKIYKRLLKLEAFLKIPYISDIKICMINSDFKIDKNIKQCDMCKILEEKIYTKSLNLLRYSFNASKYPGINVKFLHEMNQTTCSIFRPGSIMITGGNNILNYKNIINDICNLLENNYNILY